MTRSTTSTSRTSPPLPSTLWFPDSDEPNAAPIPGAVLPAWALDKIRTEFVGCPASAPAPLLKIAIRDAEAGMDARIPSTMLPSGADGGEPARPPTLILAELHPDALPASTEALPTGGVETLGSVEDGWPDFFHRAHRLLPSDGLMLLATRQRRDADRLRDPLGTLVATARTAGFHYLQHIVVVYAHLAGDQLVPSLPPDAHLGLAHCDLVALSAIRHP
ncbi:hypothetical protein AAHZ94_02240 [Streptomyces sp. HSW2009]|uniref:hypothetical protein n=1 Tax=Streptomyces sp. HSW2009 TaxID=3142890 RepID=UPI0032EFD80E